MSFWPGFSRKQIDLCVDLQKKHNEHDRSRLPELIVTAFEDGCGSPELAKLYRFLTGEAVTFVAGIPS